jgi:hypothetical protein
VELMDNLYPSVAEIHVQYRQYLVQEDLKGAGGLLQQQLLLVDLVQNLLGGVDQAVDQRGDCLTQPMSHFRR